MRDVVRIQWDVAGEALTFLLLSAPLWFCIQLAVLRCYLRAGGRSSFAPVAQGVCDNIGLLFCAMGCLMYSACSGLVPSVLFKYKPCLIA
jgi:hypothetical protein